MKTKIPVILVLMLLTGSLVNAHSPQYSEKLHIDHKKIFSRVIGESGSGNTRFNKGFPYHKATTASWRLTNPYGNVTHYGYDGYDRISKVTDPLNNVTLIGRANTGNLLSLKQLDATGQQILMQSIRINDPAGRLKSYTVKMPNPDDDITYTRIYEDNGKRIIFKDPLERQTVVQMNDVGKVDTVTDAAGNSIKYYYEDGRGNATKVEETLKSADGTQTETHTTEYEYNAHNQVETIKTTVFDSKTQTEVEAITTFYYDFKGNLTGTVDAEGNSITHKYDELDRRIKTEQHFKDTSLKPVETTFEYYPVNTYNNTTHEGTYSPSNRLKSITDDKGNKTTYEYDYQNRVKKVIYPDLTFTEYTYDKTATGSSNSSGNPTYYRLVVEKQRNGSVVTNYYDQLQRLMKREIVPAEGSAGTTIETFTYDELSRLKHAADDDTTLDYQFDRASRMDWEKQAGKLIDYTYNKVSNLTDLKYPNTRLIEREYDRLNRMNLIKEGDFDLASMIHIGRSYRLLRKQYGNGDLITYLYDRGRRLETLEARNKNTGSLINGYRYGYNKINLKTYEQRMHNADKGDVYGYDALYRLTNVKFNVPGSMLQNPTEFEREKSINHDNLHNTISIIESFNGQTRSIYPDIPEGSDYWKLNQVARFDQWGLEYDKNGNLKQKGTQRYTHDYRNQLISAVDGTLQVEMKYDVMGRRVQKAVTQGSQTKVRNFYYSGYQLIEERDGNDQVTRQYIYGNGIDEIIRMDKYQGTNVTSYYFHTDSIGSITAITDSQGNLVERVTYDTYGMPTFWDPAGNKIPESLIGNTILFQGREYDPELNLYYYRARYYDPIMGRFLETDPMGYADSMNLYQGFNMNPANFVDPLGLGQLARNQFNEILLYLKTNELLNSPDFDTKSDDGRGLEINLSLYLSELKKKSIDELEAEYKAFTGEPIYREMTFFEKVKNVWNYLPDRAYSSSYKFWTNHLEKVDERFENLDPALQDEFYIENENYKNAGKYVGDVQGSIARDKVTEIQIGIIFGVINAAREINLSKKPTINSRGTLQWRDPKTGKFVKSPVKLPQGTKFPKGTDFKKIKEGTLDLKGDVIFEQEMKEKLERLRESKIAESLLDVFDLYLKVHKKKKKG